MGKKANTIWTHAVYLILDTGDEDEASLLKVGAARLTGSSFFVELAPGLSVSGRIVIKLTESRSA